MNRFLYGFLAFLFLFLSLYPFSNVFADNDLIITGTPIPVQGDITDDQLKDIIVAGITADLVSQGYSIDLSASDGDWDNFKNAVLDYIFNSAASGSGFWGEIYNSALYHNLIDENFTLWYPDNSDGSILPGISKRSIYRNLSENLINNFLDSRSDSSNNTPTPNPDVDYSFILTDNDWYISSSVNEKYIASGAYTSLGPTQFPDNTNSNGYYNAWLSSSRAQQYTFFNKNSIQPNGEIWTNTFYISPFTTIYISTENGCHATYSGFSNDYIKYNTQNVYGVNIRNQLPVSDNYNSKYWSMYAQYASSQSFNPQTSFTGLSVAINYIHSHFRHYNLYVDNELWLYSYTELLPTIIINPGYVLQGTDYPMQYNFPDPPSFDYQRMIDIIKHALLQYGVIQWEDIADVFVDVNGQTAVAILEIHRNDYDILYDEQYPGISLPNRFNTHLLDSSHQYLSPVVQTVEETTGILPGEIKGALAIGMMLTIFACLIHRLLE